MSIKILDSLEVSLYVNCYKSIESKIQWSEFPNGKQTGLQYIKGTDPWHGAVGRMNLTDDWQSDVVINEYFKNTVFEEVIKKYQLTRTRLMWLKPFSCYSMHQDDAPRLHIPLITNPDCYFVFRDTGLSYLEAGKVYWVDTTQSHSAMNCSKEWRLHLLGSF